MFALVALFGTNFVASNPSQADDPDWVVDQESGWSVEASEGRILRITEPGTYTISRPASKNANCGIDVRAPGEVTLRLDGINCGGDWNTICGINLDRDGRRWNTNIILTEGSKNYFLSAVEANGGPANTCGINHPAGGGGVLTIDAEGDGSGYLYARGGEYYLGIGSKGGWWGEKAGKIVINGGHIRAEGSLKSASIGGGRWQSSEGVTINGGVIEAASGHHAAGVIGAYEAERTSGTILINDGIIIAGSIGGFATSNSTVIVNAGTLYRRNYDQDGGQLFHLNTKTVIRDGSACSAPLSHVRLSEEEDAPNIHVARIPITNPDVRSIIIDPHENRPRTVTRPGDTINAEGTWSNTTFCPWLAGTYHEILADGVTYIAKRTEDQQAFTVKQPNIAPAIASAQANTSSIQATLENDESATRGAVQYRWRKAGEENWANWTGSITRLTADTLYEVQARYLENDTYWSSDPSETFRVRTEPNVSLPTGLSGTSGTSLSQISLSNYARWSWQNPQTMLTATDAQQFPAKFQVANAPEQATSWNGFPTGCTYSESDVAIVCPLTVRVNATRNSWQSGHELAVRDGAYGSGSFAASGTLTYGQVSFIYSGIWGTQYAASETAPTEAGTYSVTASANAGVNSQGIVYQAFSDARNFRITQTDWSLRAPVAKIGLNYNAAAQKLLEDPGQASDSSGSTGTLRYLVQQGEPVQNFSEQDPRWTTDPNSVVGTDGGEYTVWWYAPADRNHTQSAYQHVRAHIAKNSWTLSQFPALADNLTYMDSKAMLTVPAHVADQTTGQNGLVEYAITNGDDRPDTPSTRWSEDIPVNSDLHAGTHSVWMRVHEDAGHNAFGPISIGSMNIARSHWEVEAPEGVEDLTYYADMPQELVVPGEVTGVGEVSGAVIEYAIGSAQTAPAEDSSAWSDEIPSAIEPGLYHVWWRVLADMNHDTLMSETPIAVEISGAPWDVEQEPLPVSNLSFTGEPLELVQPGRLWDETGAEHGFEYAVFTDPTATPTETDWSETTPVASDANTYIVWYRSKPDGVHTPIEPAQYTVEIARAPIPVPPAVNGLVYDGSEKTGVPAATEYTVEANTATEAKTYTATVTVGSNWYWNDGLGNPTGSRPVEWSIAKADWLVDAPVIAPFTFDGNAHELV